MKNKYIPSSTVGWLFLLHGIIDILFALILFIIPDQTVDLFGLELIPHTSDNRIFIRIFAAALAAIGHHSLQLAYKKDIEKRIFLLSKIIWASVVTFSSILYLLERNIEKGSLSSLPWGWWVIFIVFAIGFITWLLSLIYIMSNIKRKKKRKSNV